VWRRKFVTTTIRSDGRQAPDLVDRNFTADRPNLLWLADISVPQQAAPPRNRLAGAGCKPP
jgi:hypothetical protein